MEEVFQGLDYAQPSQINVDEESVALGKENNVEYERVDEEGDDYRRILVKFNPKFLRGSDFEIEFIPLKTSVNIGRIFVTEIDSMSTIDLYRWASRQICITSGLGKYEAGTIIPKKVNLKSADIMKAGWRGGTTDLEPRQVISRVKRIYEIVANEFSKPVAFALNYFLFSGRLGSLPYISANFEIGLLRKMIEDVRYPCENADGKVVDGSLVEHLFDTHKTTHVINAINNFLDMMLCLREELLEKHREEENP